MTDTRNNIGELVFTGDGTEWSAGREAQGWVTDNGYSIGPTCISKIRGILFTPGVNIAKWRRLTSTERAECDATLHGDSRNGPLVLHMNVPQNRVAR